MICFITAFLHGRRIMLAAPPFSIICGILASFLERLQGR
jgi:hypothetical protein